MKDQRFPLIFERSISPVLLLPQKWFLIGGSIIKVSYSAIFLWNGKQIKADQKTLRDVKGALGVEERKMRKAGARAAEGRRRTIDDCRR